MARYLMLLFCVLSTLVVARPPDGKDKGRVYDGKVSDEEHFNEGGEHNSDYDHEAFLGDEKRTFDQLTPEESKERLGKLVDRIDKDHDGKVTMDELKEWIKITSKRYIYDDVERQWNHMKKMEQSSLSSDKIYAGVRVLTTDPISWEKYRNLTYGYITEESQFDYKDMVRRDRRRWERADLDKDDQLTREEYTAFLHPEEFEHMKDVVVDETLEDIDKDKDGSLSLEEYLGDLYPENEKEEGKEEPEWIKTEREHFSDYRDRNKDGKMDRREVMEWIIPSDYDHVEAEAKHLIHAADANQDKMLTKEEILDKHDVFVGSQATEYGEALARHDEF